MIDGTQLAANFRYRRLTWVAVALLTFASLIWGVATGTDIAGNSWENNELLLHFLMFFLVSWQLNEAARLFQRSSSITLLSKPTMVRSVIEKRDSDDGTCYEVFIRGSTIPKAGYSNWRARILEPCPYSVLDQHAEEDRKVDVWFEGGGEPALIRIDGLSLELGAPKRVNHRWTT